MTLWSRKTEIVFFYKTDSNNLIYNILATNNYTTVQSPFNFKNDWINIQ